MTTLYEIEEAIAKLPAAEYGKFLYWFKSFESNRKGENTPQMSFEEFLLTAPKLDVDFDFDSVRDRTEFPREIRL